MIKTTVHCDVCEKRVDYMDSDLDVNVQGFTLVEKNCKVNVQYCDHVRHSCGSTSHPINLLVLPEHVCSKKCITDFFMKWCSELLSVETPS